MAGFDLIKQLADYRYSFSDPALLSTVAQEELVDVPLQRNWTLINGTYTNVFPADSVDGHALRLVAAGSNSSRIRYTFPADLLPAGIWTLYARYRNSGNSIGQRVELAKVSAPDSWTTLNLPFGGTNFEASWTKQLLLHGQLWGFQLISDFTSDGSGMIIDIRSPRIANSEIVLDQFVFTKAPEHYSLFLRTANTPTLNKASFIGSEQYQIPRQDAGGQVRTFIGARSMLLDNSGEYLDEFYSGDVAHWSYAAYALSESQLHQVSEDSTAFLVTYHWHLETDLNASILSLLPMVGVNVTFDEDIYVHGSFEIFCENVEADLTGVSVGDALISVFLDQVFASPVLAGSATVVMEGHLDVDFASFSIAFAGKSISDVTLDAVFSAPSLSGAVNNTINLTTNVTLSAPSLSGTLSLGKQQ